MTEKKINEERKKKVENKIEDGRRSKDQKKFISNTSYNSLNILHQIYMYQKLYVHYWQPEYYFKDTNRGFKFVI